MRYVLAVLVALVLPASAAAKITPSRSVTASSITVSWKTDRHLFPGWRYRVYIVIASQRPGCDSGGVVNPEVRVAKGRRARVFISADVRWCPGQAFYAVDLVRPGRETLNLFTASVRVPSRFELRA